MTKKHTLLSTFTLIGSLATSQATFTLLDDFESYAAGDITTQSANWSFSAVNDATVGSDAGNQFLIQGGTTNAHTIFNNGTTLIADETVGTYFFRAYMPSGGSHHGAGVSPLETTTGWGNGQAIARFGSSGLSTNTFAYNGDATAGYDSLTALSNDLAWYNVWLVIDNSGAADRTYDVYLQSDDDTDFLAQTQVGTGLEYRENASTTQTSLESLFFRTANNGSSLSIDDLYIDGSGQNLANPANPVPEPAASILGAIGLLGLLRRRR